MNFVIMSYNPSKNYMWTMHKEGCRDIQQELKGIRTDSGFPAIDPTTVVAKNAEEATEQWIDEELRELGYDANAIKVNPCCHEKDLNKAEDKLNRVDLINKAEINTAMTTIGKYDNQREWQISQMNRLEIERRINTIKAICVAIGCGFWIKRTESKEYCPFEDIEAGTGGITLFKAKAVGLVFGQGTWRTETWGF